MPNYTLYYFNGRGRAEILRMMFAAANVKYMDKRFEFNEWDKYRKDMPSMCVPVLEMDGGNKMPETMAIARYLAREFGFYGKSNMDMMRCDYIADCFYEIMHDYMRYFHEKNGRFRFNMEGSGSGSGMNSPTGASGDMNSKFDTYLQWRFMNTCSRVLPFLERSLEMQNGGKSFFMGEQMMWCDMMCYCALEGPFQENQSLFSKFPKLMALRNRIAGHPKISGYLKSRTNTNW
uniref:S-crystallin n=1 Tax=Doryteuthis opalescens TaxID=1051066 RepID=Q25375_DOROP|nr:S-crystallin [Doryteuthis opalescens]